MAQLEKTKLHKYYATVVMIKPHEDFWLYKPTKEDVLEALAELILTGQLDDHFQITFRE